MPGDDRRLLEDLYRAAVAGVDPARDVSAALTSDGPSERRAPWILALGKAGSRMCDAAIDVLESCGSAPAGALVVTTEGHEMPGAGIEGVCGDHPVPGPGSFAAAERISALVNRVSGGGRGVV